jgi:TonB-linked SusC/RagA family outer membrane protein
MSKINQRLYWNMLRKILFVFVVICVCTVTVFAQGEIKVSGTVTDKTGEPIPGVAVITRGTTNGVVTGEDGIYIITVPNREAILVFSFVGFSTEEIKVGSQTSINVILNENAIDIDEVVVVGYGSQRKADLTGSVTSIKAKDLTGIRGGNAAEALQGKSGLYVVTPGAPGSSPGVRIRGIGTNSDASPIYVVDGVMTNSISYLNTNDIESMDILKDASATAIYGSRGANGVIMITTKKGKSGKTIVSYSGKEGFQYVINKFDVCDGFGYANLMNIIAEIGNQAKPYQNPSQYGKGTNWMDEITRKGWTRDHQLSVSGGSERVNYNLSAGFFDQQGIWKNTDYNRWSFRANTDYKINSKIKLGHNLAFSTSNSGQSLSYRTVRSVLSSSPLIIPKNEQGGWNSMQNGELINPVAELELNKNYNSNNLRFVGNIFGTWDIVKGLIFRTSLGEDWSHTYMDQFKPAYSINPSHQSNPTNTYNEYYSTGNTWLWENTLTYDTLLDNIHRLTLLAGYTAEKTKSRGLGANAKSYIVDNLDYVTIASALPTNRTVDTQFPSTVTRLSYLFRANYALKDRYLFTATFRADGSSKFGVNNRWGYFPSAALGWRIKEESFLKDVDWLSNLKIRGSWGLTGNDKIRDNVSYALVDQADEWHAVFAGRVHPAAGIVNAYNPDVKWERNEQIDLGFDLGLFRQMLTFEFDYYNRITRDLLMVLPVKGSSGASGPSEGTGAVGIYPTYSNAGSVRNSGFEVTIRWQDDRHPFKYGFGVSGSTVKNEVIDWKDLVTTNNEWSTSLDTRIEEGQPFNYFYGYQTQGIYRTQADLDKWNQYAQGKGQTAYHSSAQLGDLIYVDVNGDGRINESDKTNIGVPFPKLTGSFTFNAEYKGFDLLLDFTGSFGAKVMNYSYNDFSSVNNNMHTDWLNAWTPNNINAEMPRLAAASINTNRTIDLMVFKGDYFKLRSAELGYTLSVNSGINKIRIYLNGANLLYFTGYKGFTPEIMNGLDWNSYPLSGNIHLGVNLTF